MLTISDLQPQKVYEWCIINILLNLAFLCGYIFNSMLILFTNCGDNFAITIYRGVLSTEISMVLTWINLSTDNPSSTDFIIVFKMFWLIFSTCFIMRNLNENLLFT